MADKQRKTHIFRLLGRRNGREDPETWIDLERQNYYQLIENTHHGFKRINARLRWYEEGDWRSPNRNRKTSLLKIMPPDVDDPDEFHWPLEIVDEIQVMDYDENQLTHVRFDNSAQNLGRSVQIRRITHFDTTADFMQHYKKGGLIADEDYRRIEGFKRNNDKTKDKEQYLDIEIITQRRFKEYGQRTKFRPKNQHWLDRADRPDTPYARGQINPPWRLDPLQTIKNVKFATLTVEFKLGGA
jgi:hypothetical protein